MVQEHKFFMLDQERVDGLRTLLLKIFEKEGINLLAKGGGRSTLDRSFDFDVYDLFISSKQVGHYEFELKKGKYHCILDLQGLPKNNYDKIKEIVKKEFPEINFSD